MALVASINICGGAQQYLIVQVEPKTTHIHGKCAWSTYHINKRNHTKMKAQFPSGKAIVTMPTRQAFRSDDDTVLRDIQRMLSKKWHTESNSTSLDSKKLIRNTKKKR